MKWSEKNLMEVSGALGFCVLALVLLMPMLTQSGCGQAQQQNQAKGGGSKLTGAISGALTLAPGEVLANVVYTITSPDGFNRSGTFNISSSTTLSFFEGGVPAGDGYKVTLKALGADGGTPKCMGTSASFSVTAGTTAMVTVHLTCEGRPSSTGSVMVNGTLNLCPIVPSISASPIETTVGSSIELSAAAYDPDQQPSGLTFKWTATQGEGEFSDDSASKPMFKCTQPGIVDVNVTVSDGDSACGDITSTVQIACTAVCPEDLDPCTDACQADGTVTHTPSAWAGCSAAAANIDQTCSVPLTAVELQRLDPCNQRLADDVASAEQSDDVDIAWNRFQTCVKVAVGCAPPDSTSVMQQPLTVLNSSICNQTAFNQCRQMARDKFLIDAQRCLVVGVTTSGLGGTGVVSFQACMVGAAAIELSSVFQCAQTNSCTPPQVCVNEMCVDQTIHVLSASYGNNCGTPVGNVTGIVKSECDGKTSCDVVCDNSIFGDPVYGCAKDCEVVYTCGPGPSLRTGSHGPVAGEGYDIPLFCP